MTKTHSLRQYIDVSAPDRPSDAVRLQFDEVYDQEFDYVWRTLGRLGVAPSDLADACHDVFVVVLQRWADLDPSRPVRPWLFGIARRIASGFRRKERVAEPVDIASPDHSDPERDVLWRALASLEEERRVVVILHDLEGHTGAAIASMLEIPVNTVHSRLRLARADLVAAVRRLERTP